MEKAMEPKGTVSPEDRRTAHQMVQALGTRGPESEDLVQEILIVLSRGSRTFAAPEGRSLEEARRAFLYEVAARVTANYRRKRARQEANTERMTAESVQLAAPSPEEAAIAGGARVLLEEAIEELRHTEPALHTVLALHLAESSTPQIAATLGVADGTVSTRLRLAREALTRTVRRKLAQDDGHWQRRTFHREPQRADGDRSLESET